MIVTNGIRFLLKHQPLNFAVREKRFETHAVMDEAYSPERETMLYRYCWKFLEYCRFADFSERSIQDVEIRLFQLRAFVRGTLLPQPGAEPELPERATIGGWLGSFSALLVSPEKRPKPACLPTGPP
jgi:hypothetical protein